MKGLIFTYTLCYGGSVYALIRPYVGLLIYISFALITPESLWYWAVPIGGYSRKVGVCMLIGWVLTGFGNWDFRRAMLPLYSLIAYWLWAILCAKLGPESSVGIPFITSFLKILIPIVMGATLINSVQQIKQLAWVLVLSLGFVAYELNIAYLGGFNRLIVAGHYAGLDNNSFCISMVTGAGLALFLGLRETSQVRRWIAFAAAGMMAHVTMFADSRGGMLGLIFAGVVSFVILPRDKKSYMFFCLALAVGLRLAGPSVVERFMTSFASEEHRDSSAQSRILLWSACWDLMQKHPFFGVGTDRFPRVSHEYGFKPGKEGHMLWLQLGAEMGFPGLGLLLGFYLITVWRLWRLTFRKDLSDPWLADAARMVIAGLAAFGVSACFVSLEGLETPYYATLLGLGVLKVESLTRPVPRRTTYPVVNMQAEPAVQV